MNNFGETIINWYSVNKRDLPWRNTKDPYFIWLSEIILQQTRVQQGLPYYESFASNYPSLSHLAKANQDDVLALWKGLGYYSRARNLLKAAQQIKNQFNGEFPKTAKELKKIIGIGEYTSAAIASFAFDEEAAVVDGNVYRVLSRVFGVETSIDSTLGQKEFKELAGSLIKGNNPALYNQSIMEFGALMCVPKNPDCNNCPLQNNCEAFHSKKIEILPVKSKKIKKKIRNLLYLISKKEDSYALIKRGEKDIWAGMYDFPCIEIDSFSFDSILPMLDELGYKSKKSVFYFEKEQKHLLTHQTIYYNFIEVRDVNDQANSYYSLDDMQSMGMSRIMEKMVDYLAK